MSTRRQMFLALLCASVMAVAACTRSESDSKAIATSIINIYNPAGPTVPAPGPAPSPGPGPAPQKYQCNDGLDNDNDGPRDYPADSDCSSPNDDSEYGSVPPPAASVAVVLTPSSILALQAPGTGCTASNPVTVTSNQPVNWQSMGSGVGFTTTATSIVFTPVSQGVTTITATALSGNGAPASISITVNACTQQNAQAPSCSFFTASPTTITAGQSSTLNWNCTPSNATCTASNGWSGSKAPTGSQSVTPATTTTHSLQCSNSAGTSPMYNATVTVTVQQQVRTIELTAPSYTGARGTTVQATATCRINGAVTNSCAPWFYSAVAGSCRTVSRTVSVGRPEEGRIYPQDASKVSVHPNTGVVTYVGSGSADICVQWSQAETLPTDFKRFTTN